MTIVAFLFVGTSITLYDYAYYILSRIVNWVSILTVCGCIAGMIYFGIKSGNEDLMSALPIPAILIMPLVSVAYEIGSEISDKLMYHIKGY